MMCESCEPIFEENKRLNKRVEYLEKELDSTKKELAKYKNSNTPSSANKHLKENTKGKKNGAKRGAPKGHKGTTRKQVPDRHEVVNTDRCPICGSLNIRDKRVLRRVVEDTHDNMTPETVATKIHEKECSDCGNTFIPPQNKTPLKGKFGINIMVLVIFLKFLLRGVLRKIAIFMESGFALTLTPVAVNSIIRWVAEAAEQDYNDIKRRIRSSDIVHVDETSFSVLGKNQWIWFSGLRPIFCL